MDILKINNTQPNIHLTTDVTASQQSTSALFGENIHSHFPHIIFNTKALKWKRKRERRPKK
ncbi:hypothetical protein T07_6794 [Trichinella nelsoni]|uniref:Uncharacterized protein n=1 Tax=Trichinella nelsoni TaxID=6336 RepID=A0A0V0RN89_9BILA|nr:hypothetical protein T07_6794 [Trichinella nelsoni]